MRDAVEISARRDEVLAKLSEDTEWPVQIEPICSKSTTAADHGGLGLKLFTCLGYNAQAGRSGVHRLFPPFRALPQCLPPSNPLRATPSDLLNIPHNSKMTRPAAKQDGFAVLRISRSALDPVQQAYFAVQVCLLMKRRNDQFLVHQRGRVFCRARTL